MEKAEKDFLSIIRVRTKEQHGLIDRTVAPENTTTTTTTATTTIALGADDQATSQYILPLPAETGCHEESTGLFPKVGDSLNQTSGSPNLTRTNNRAAATVQPSPSSAIASGILRRTIDFPEPNIPLNMHSSITSHNSSVGNKCNNAVGQHDTMLLYSSALEHSRAPTSRITTTTYLFNVLEQLSKISQFSIHRSQLIDLSFQNSDPSQVKDLCQQSLQTILNQVQQVHQSVQNILRDVQTQELQCQQWHHVYMLHLKKKRTHSSRDNNKTIKSKRAFRPEVHNF
jgi:hypothetical protein